MVVKVRTPEGDLIPLEVTPNDTINDIKDMVKDKAGIPVDEQRPVLDGKPLPDKSTLDDNGIKHGDIIDLDPMEIYVKDPSGKKHTLPVSPAETIDEVQDKVKDKTGIPKKDQRLTFKGKPLDKPNKTLKDCGVKHKDTLDLEPMVVKVRTPEGDLIPLEVTPNDTINDIKDMVKDKAGIPVDEQRPVLDGKPLPDKSTLDDNGIKHGDIIDLLEPMEIFVVDLDGKKHTYSVDPADAISSIKSRVEGDTGIPVAKQRLAFLGMPLEKDSKSLSDCGIKNHDTLKLEPFTVHVRTPEGKIVSLDVDPENIVEDIKKMIEDGEKIPAKDQTLKAVDGTPLEDHISLNDAGVKHDDTLDLELPPPKMVARMTVSPSKSPKKKSYINPNWKEEQDRFMQVRVRTYKTRYDGEPEESFIEAKTSDVTTTTKIEKVQSPMKKNRKKAAASDANDEA